MIVGRLRLCTLLMLAACLAWSQGVTPAVSPRDVDMSAARSLRGGRTATLEATAVRDVLFGGGEYWDAREGDGEAARYAVGFREPAAIGSVISDATAVYVLRADAPYPGDLADDAHWLALTRHTSGGAPWVYTAPPGTETRGLRADLSLATSRSLRLSMLTPVRARLSGATDWARVNANAEYTLYPGASPPVYYKATNVLRGGEWRPAGTNKEGNNTTPPITDLNPAWFIVSFQEPRQLVGVATTTSARAITVYTYVGPDGINPVVATDREWRKVPRVELIRHYNGRVTLRLPEPLTTRGLKLVITKGDERDAQVVSIKGLQVLEAIGDGPIPEPPDRRRERPPLTIPYELPTAGYFTMAIDDADGRRVRNLVANTEREAGPNTEAWDLKDGSGQFVPPGEYRYRAIYHPPLTLRYETTVYPNVTTHFPDRAAWLTGHNDPHGWMADHSPTKRVTTDGDRIWFGAPVAESGVSLSETDLSGRKLWGLHSFAAFTGVHDMAADATHLYAAAPLRNAIKYIGGDPNSEGIWAIDRQTHKEEQIAYLPPTNSRMRGIVGMAAHDGRIYLSVRADARWLVPAAQAADVDLVASQPAYKPKREPKRPYEVVPDPRQDFMRLFRLTRYPPGYGGDGPLVYLESTHGPSSRQFIVLAFNREVPLGSAVLPVPVGAEYKVELSVLRADAPWPPVPGTAAHWTPVPVQPTRAWDCVAFPEGTKTRALRIAFLKGEDDMFAEVMDGGGEKNPDDLLGGDQGLGMGSTSWHGQLEGMTLLRRRYRNLAASATIRVNSGTVTKSGVWDAKRSEPVSPEAPGIYVMQWDAAQNVRGLAIKEIDGEKTLIDVWTGPAGAVDLTDDTHWRQVGSYTQPRRNLHTGMEVANPKARYLDGYVDFGEEVETHALRLRVVSQWVDNGGRGELGRRDDRGDHTIMPNACGLDGVAPLAYLGGEDPSDPLLAERIEVFSAKEKKVIAETYLAKPGPLATGPGGQLYALSGSTLMAVDLDHHQHQPVITDLLAPTAFTLDADGNIYVYDGAPERQVIRVYDPAGAYQRDIGTPGGYRVGPWDPMRMRAITSIAATTDGHIWAVSHTTQPKRVAQYTLAGEHVKDIFGPTRYGGNGVLDPWDKTRLYVNNAEFAIDWDTGKVRLLNLLWLGTDTPERPVHVDGRTYMVTRVDVHGPNQAVGVVYLREGDSLRRVAAMGQASAFEPLKSPDVLPGLGGVTLPGKGFLWVDRNGDGETQAAEVQILGEIGRTRPTVFNRDLGLQMGRFRFEVKGFQADGVPLYEYRETKATSDFTYRLETGGYMSFGSGDGDSDIKLRREDGSLAWYIDAEPSGVHGLFKAKPYYDGQIVSLFSYIGEEDAAAGDLGHFVVMSANDGAWRIISDDGLYVGDILRNYRRGDALAWKFPEHERGMEMPNLTAGQEHFRGYFTRIFADDKYYIVAGHNHASVVEVQGLENVRRLNGTITVAPEQLLAAQAWERDREQDAVYARAPVYDCYQTTDTIVIDGQADDWRESAVAAMSEEESRANAWFRMVYDDANLYLLYQVTGYGPFLNGGEDFRRSFKSGAAVDIQLGTDPAADSTRRAPVPGDLRLLISPGPDGQTRAVLYRPVVPGTPVADRWIVHSPVTSEAFDSVELVAGAEIKALPLETGYIVEARIPLAALGLKPAAGLRLKFDWGLLEADRDGNAVTSRVYWANKATSIVADAPSEARLQPDLWGVVRLHAKKKSALNQTLDANPLLDDVDPVLDNATLDELEGEL